MSIRSGRSRSPGAIKTRSSKIPRIGSVLLASPPGETRFIIFIAGSRRQTFGRFPYPPTRGNHRKRRRPFSKDTRSEGILHSRRTGKIYLTREKYQALIFGWPRWKARERNKKSTSRSY